MVDNPLIIWSAVGSFLSLVIFLLAKVYRDRRRIGRPVLWTMLGCSFCLAIWAGAVVPRPLHLWQRVVGAASAPATLLLYYAAIKQMFQANRSWSLLRSKIFWYTLLLVASTICLDLCLGENAPVYDSTDPTYAPSLLSLAESALGYLALLSLDVLIIQVYFQCWRRISYPLDHGRLGLGLLAFLVNALALVLVEGGVVLAFCGQGRDRIVLNAIYHISLVVTALLLACSYILPESWLLLLLRPLASARARQQEEQWALLRQLHQAMVSIVPGVQLPCQPIHDLRVLIEISDARQIIWSQQPHTRPLTPLEEARHLRALLSAQTVLTTPGAYAPVPIRLADTVRHNVLVAKRLFASAPEKEGRKTPPAPPRRKRFRVLRLVVSAGTLLILVGLLLFLLDWYLCNLLMYPQRVALTHPPTVPYQTVQFETSDHIIIRGWFVPAPGDKGKAPTLLLLHGISDNRTVFTRVCPVVETKDGCPLTRPSSIKSTYPTLVDALHWNGYALLLIDQRAQGVSGGTICTYGLDETRDVAAALAYLQKRPDVDQSRLGIYGTSMGAMTAIHAAALMPAWRAVAVESPFASLVTTLEQVTAPRVGLPSWVDWPVLTLYRLRTGVDLSNMRNIDDMAALGQRPFYAIADMKDTVTMPGDARLLYNASRASLRELWEVPDAGHTEARFLHPNEFDQRLIAFFNAALHTHPAA
ncbi:MAG TPA: CocE/NonD family hydrolase [Ktedonobacteraceae bacterium]|nr:CocE/NonD family hydrolase [Ktedonobacteraceae bacterium]